MKELCTAFILNLGSDFDQLEDTDKENLNKVDKDKESVQVFGKMFTRSKTRVRRDKVVNQGFKTLFEEDNDNSLMNQGKIDSSSGKTSSSSSNVSFTQTKESNQIEGKGIVKEGEESIEDFSLDNLEDVIDFDENVWTNRVCPHCLSIDEIEEMLKKEAEKIECVTSFIRNNNNNGNGNGNNNGRSGNGTSSNNSEKYSNCGKTDNEQPSTSKSSTTMNLSGNKIKWTI